MDTPDFLAPIVQQHGLRFLRYAGVSVVALVVGQGLLVLLYSGFGMSAVLANVVASTIGAIPAYVLNRYWVWKKTSKNLFWSEIAPFWGMAFVGLVISTVFVAVVSARYDSVIAITLASLAAYGLVWVGKYFVLHNLLFADGHAEAATDLDSAATPLAR